MPGRPAPRRLPIAAGRTPGPTAAIIDSQSVKAAEEVARAGRGYDAGKKINGKRHREGIAVDVLAGQVVRTCPAPQWPQRPGQQQKSWDRSGYRGGSGLRGGSGASQRTGSTTRPGQARIHHRTLPANTANRAKGMRDGGNPPMADPVT